MGFIDGLSKIIRPIEDDEDNDFFDGSNESTKTSEPAKVSEAQAAFEKVFGGAAASSPVEEEEETEERSGGFNPDGGIFGTLGARRAKQQNKFQRERTVNFGGRDSQVILFNPKSFDEAGELVSHLSSGRSVVMTLEGVPLDMARRLLDFLSGVTFALNGKITPVSAKTYFVTPENVDLLSADGKHTESSGEYL